MLDHIGFGVSDIDLSHDFFIKALAPLGVSLVMQGPTSLGLGRQGKPSLWLYSGTHVSAPLHIAISADDHAQVDAFHRAALAAGGKDNGPPRPAPALPSPLLCRLCHRPGRPQSGSRLPPSPGVTAPVVNDSLTLPGLPSIIIHRKRTAAPSPPRQEPIQA